MSSVSLSVSRREAINGRTNSQLYQIVQQLFERAFQRLSRRSGIHYQTGQEGKGRKRDGGSGVENEEAPARIFDIYTELLFAELVRAPFVHAYDRYNKRDNDMAMLQDTNNDSLGPH